VSTEPYRLVVTGRIKHYISAFGEHVIGEEVEQAMLEAAKEHNAHIIEFTVAPRINVDGELPYHEWFVEFENMPDNFKAFELEIDSIIRKRNIYYEDLITGGILQPLKVRTIKRQGFQEYMKSEGKLGGQNKVPRLSNDRNIVDALETWVAK
jgi:hypothetical protein